MEDIPGYFIYKGNLAIGLVIKTKSESGAKEALKAFAEPHKWTLTEEIEADNDNIHAAAFFINSGELKPGVCVTAFRVSTRPCRSIITI